MRSTNEVKYLSRALGGMLEYETGNHVDTTVTHTSYASLTHALRRTGRDIIFIHCGGNEIVDEGSYTRNILPTKKRLTVLYRETNATALFRGFHSLYAAGRAG